MSPVIHVYECSTAPPARRFLAQFDVVKNNRYITISGPSREIAMACAHLHLEFQSIPLLRRKDFNLVGKLAELRGESAVPSFDAEDLL